MNMEIVLISVLVGLQGFMIGFAVASIINYKKNKAAAEADYDEAFKVLDAAIRLK